MCPDATMGTDSTALSLKALCEGRVRATAVDPPGPKMYSCAPCTPPPQGEGYGKEAGENPAQAPAGWVTDDPSVTLAALVGRGLGSCPRTLEALGML